MLLRLQKISTGQFLIMAKDDVLTVEIRSTLFNDQEDLLGSFSYEGAIPLEPNRHLIQNAHLINTSSDLRTFPVLCYLGALAWKQVNFNFTIEADEIKYNLFIDMTILANRLKQLNLNNFPGDPYEEALHFDTPEEYINYVTSTITAVPGDMPMVFFPYKNDGAYKDVSNPGDYLDISFPVSTYFNAWKVVDGVGSFSLATSWPQKYTDTPFFYLVYILKRICKYLGFTPIGDWLKEADANRITMFSNVPVAGYQSIYNFNYFMPGILVNTFLKTVRTEFGLLIDFDITRGIAVIESFSNLERTGEVLDLRGRQLYGFRETTSVLKAYTITRAADEKDTAFTDDEKKALPVVAIGDQSGNIEITPIELTTAATKMLVETRPGSATQWRIPYIKMPVDGAVPLQEISQLAYADRYKFKERFLYWHGMVPDSAGFLYPYGSSDNKNYLFQPISRVSLALDDASNAVLTIKRFLQFIKNSKPFEVGFFCTPYEFLKVSSKSLVLIQDRNDATIKCLFDSAVADFENKDEIFCKITIYPIIWPNNTKEFETVLPELPEPEFDNGDVWVVMQLGGFNNENHLYPPPAYQITLANLDLQFFADAAKTIPKAVTDLKVSINIRRNPGDGSGFTESNSTFKCNGTVQRIFEQVAIGSTLGDSVEFMINPNTNYNS